MRPLHLAAAVSATALLACAGAAMAQSETPLRIGQTVTGELADPDPVAAGDEGGYRYEDYVFSARAGQRLEATLMSEAFDAYLEIFAQDDTDEALASDDDGGDDTNSRLRFTPESAGTYVLRARTLEGAEGGAYTLALGERPPAPRAPRPAGIRVGQTVRGALADTDAQNDDEARYDAYAFRAREGERVAIALNSDAFDPVVVIGQMNRGDYTELARNDDASGGGLNSYLVFTAPRAGEYVIRAGSLEGDGLGDYSLTLSEGPAALPTRPLTMGQTISGSLSQDDGKNDAGARADAYRIDAPAGTRIVATMDSEAFDTFLELYDAQGTSVDSDDDGGAEGTNSRLVYTLGDAGPYVLQARALGDDATGDYSLALSEGQPAPAPAALAMGETVQGEVTTDDATDDDGRSFEAYRFSGTEGNRVQVIMRSGDFDTFLQIGRAGDDFEMLASDDDGLGEGTDSRLNYLLPETGEYVIRASPLSGGVKGLYSIELIDRGPQPAPGSIQVGATARGTLTDDDGVTDDGAAFDAYLIDVAAGEKLIVTMVSNDFDAYLDIGKEEGGTFESVIADDDGLSDTHAKVDWTVEDAGTYVIRARSFASGQTGAYAMTVERKP